MSSENKRPQLHVSALNMLSFCGEQFRRRYVCGDKIPPGIALIVGTATHKSVETNLRAKMEKKDMEMAAVEAVAADSLKAEWERGVMLTDDEQKEGIKKVKGDAVDKAVRMARVHAFQVAPNIHPVAVERSWALELTGYPMDFVGTIDVLESGAIRDTKTASKSPAEDAATAARSTQLTAYALACKILDGAAPSKVFLDYLVDLKSGVKAVTLEAGRTDADFQSLLRRLEVAMTIIEKQAFMPANSRDPMCSPRFCGYHAANGGGCPYTSA